MSERASQLRGDLEIEGKSVVLRTNTCNLRLRAADIYALVSSGCCEVAKLTRPVAESAPGIAFMSRPLSVYVWARNPAGSGLLVDAAVTVRGQPEILPELADDHVLLGDVWHPLELESLGAVRGWLKGRAIGETSLAAYANIYHG